MGCAAGVLAARLVRVFERRVRLRADVRGVQAGMVRRLRRQYLGHLGPFLSAEMEGKGEGGKNLYFSQYVFDTVNETKRLAVACTGEPYGNFETLDAGIH